MNYNSDKINKFKPRACLPRVFSASIKMKTITKSEEIIYSTPSFQDAITMLSLMDQIYDCACKELANKAYNELPEEEKKLYRTPWTGNIRNAEKVYELLTSLGFCTSHGEELKASLQKKPSQEA